MSGTARAGSAGRAARRVGGRFSSRAPGDLDGPDRTGRGRRRPRPAGFQRPTCTFHLPPAGREACVTPRAGRKSFVAQPTCPRTVQREQRPCSRYPRIGPRRTCARSVEVFARQIFGYLPCADQHRWAGTCLKGLLLPDGRKSVRRLAGAASGSPTGWYSLQQFVDNSPWDREPGRDALVRWIGRRSPVRAWTVVPVVLPKRGDQSVGVHQRFTPLSGRAVNCQMATVLPLSCPGADFPVDRRLFLPRQWTDDPGLRRRARIPRGRELPSAVAARPGPDRRPGRPHRLAVGAGGGRHDRGARRDGADRAARRHRVRLRRRRPPACPVGGRGAGRRGAPGRASARGAARRPRRGPGGAAGDAADTGAPWMGNRHAAAVTGSDGRFRQTQVLSAPIRRPVREGPGAGGERRAYRLFSELGPDGAPDSRLRLTDLVHHRLDELLELARCHVSALDTTEYMDGRYELLDFTGRSFPAWHHHMTMVSAAYAHLRPVGSTRPAVLVPAGTGRVGGRSRPQARAVSAARSGRRPRPPSPRRRPRCPAGGAPPRRASRARRCKRSAAVRTYRG
ncbi:hypothetical protein SUDANB6_04145 [Streptomyces sp. enrichment culture]